MKRVILALILLLPSLTFSQDVEIKEISKTEFRIQHKFVGSDTNREAYENRLFTLYSESTVESLHIEKDYINITFRTIESRDVIEVTLLEFSGIFGYKSIKIK